MYMYYIYTYITFIHVIFSLSLLTRDYEDLHLLLHEGEPCTSCGLRFREDQEKSIRLTLTGTIMRTGWIRTGVGPQ